jgi:hypothetical protein
VLSDDLTDDLVEGDLSTDDQFIDFWGDDVLVEEDLERRVSSWVTSVRSMYFP